MGVAGLFAYREIDDVFGLTDMAATIRYLGHPNLSSQDCNGSLFKLWSVSNTRSPERAAVVKRVFLCFCHFILKESDTNI